MGRSVGGNRSPWINHPAVSTKSLPSPARSTVIKCSGNRLPVLSVGARKSWCDREQEQAKGADARRERRKQRSSQATGNSEKTPNE